jgi:hypothetical protein
MGDDAIRFQKLFFGFSQLYLLQINALGTLIILSALIVILAIFRWPVDSRYLLTSDGSIRPSLRLEVSLLAIALFLALSNNFINPDGKLFSFFFARDIPLWGTHLSHDEMFEFYLHSRFWFYTHHYFGFTIPQSYQVLSSFAGGVFIFLLLSYCPKISRNKPFTAFFLCISAGYIQLFFGDVENYTITTTWLMGYFYASALFLEKRISIIGPSALLAIAMTFHLLSAFLLPSLLFLYVISWIQGEKKYLFFALAISLLIIGTSLWFAGCYGLPLHKLWTHTHAFGEGGKKIYNMFKLRPLHYYFEILNLIFLLLPAWIFMAPLFLCKCLFNDRINTHLFISFCGMMVLLVGWKAELGVYNDWNLFAPVALPTSLLVWRSILNHHTLMATKEWSLPFIGSMFFLHSYCWVVSNHFPR